MNKRIRKKKEKQRIARTIRELVMGMYGSDCLCGKIRDCLQHKQSAEHQRKSDNLTDYWRSSAYGKCGKGAAYFGRFVPVLFQRGV